MANGYYETGTVSITNNTTALVGVGTAWLSFGLKAGDKFVKNGLSVRIASVNSNTSITLSENWTGGTLSAGTVYAIEPLPDTTRALEALTSLYALLGGQGNISALAALAGTADKLPYFTGAGALALADLPQTSRDLLASGGVAAYTGLVASSGFTPDTRSTSNKQIMSRTQHQARDAVTSLQLAWANWYVTSVGVETALGGSSTITASIEYPAGTFTQVTFAASSSGTLANGVTTLSDAINVLIPDGATFWVRSFVTSSTGIVYRDFFDNTLLGAAELASSGLTDKTMSGTISPSGTFAYAPVAIIGTTTKPTALLLGDSQTYGLNDTMDAALDVGNLARSLSPAMATINAGRISDRAMFFVASHGLRAALAQWVSHVVVEFGINDLATAAGNHTAVQVKADVETIIGYFPGKPVWTVTIVPRTTSSDSWATVGNQTVDGNNSGRVAYNGYVRTGLTGAAGFFEIADVVESARDSGKWKAPGYTGDGNHETPYAYRLIRDMDAVDPAVFKRPSAGLQRLATPSDMRAGVAKNLLVSPAMMGEFLKGLTVTPFTSVTVKGLTIVGAGTYTAQFGWFFRIGNLVYVFARVAWSAHTGTGFMYIDLGGAVPLCTSLYNQPLALSYSGLTFSGNVVALMELGAGTIGLYDQTTGAGATRLNMDTAASMNFSGVYLTDDAWPAV